MIEPVVVREHGALTHKPELQGKQALFDCGNGYGLSMVWAKGSRWEHGLYCSDEPIQTYEILLIEIVSENGEFDWSFVSKDGYHSRGYCEPKGWQTIDEVGAMLQAIEVNGIDAWDNFMKSSFDSEDE